MSMKKYRVTLTETERHQLHTYISTGTHAARSLTRARVLLLADRGDNDSAIAQALGVCLATVFNLRRRACQDGVEATLTDRPRPGSPRRLTGRDEAMFTTLACSDPPEGFHRWTIRLLADRFVQLATDTTISKSTVHEWLKKTTSHPGKNANGVSARSRADV